MIGNRDSRATAKKPVKQGDSSKTQRTTPKSPKVTLRPFYTPLRAFYNPVRPADIYRNSKHSQPARSTATCKGMKYACDISQRTAVTTTAKKPVKQGDGSKTQRTTPKSPEVALHPFYTPLQAFYSPHAQRLEKQTPHARNTTTSPKA
jgi:hypothetical protein